MVAQVVAVAMGVENPARARTGALQPAVALSRLGEKQTSCAVSCGSFSYLTHTLSSRLLSYRRWDDIIQAELGNNLKEDGTIQGRPAADVVKEKTALDPDKPGLGQYYCVACARYCISAKALADHQSQKKHKRRLKTLLTEKPYSHAEANAAAGRGATDHGLSRDRAAVPESMST